MSKTHKAHSTCGSLWNWWSGSQRIIKKKVASVSQLQNVLNIIRHTISNPILVLCLVIFQYLSNFHFFGRCLQMDPINSCSCHSAINSSVSIQHVFFGMALTSFAMVPSPFCFSLCFCNKGLHSKKTAVPCWNTRVLLMVIFHWQFAASHAL